LILLIVAAACEATPAAPGAEDDEPEPSGSVVDSGASARAPDAQVARDAGSKPTQRDAAPAPALDPDLGGPAVDASSATDAGGDAGRNEASGDAGSTDAKGFASALDALFVDVPCAPATPTPIAKMATCQHPGTTQHIDKKLQFGGQAGTIYDVKLRIRGIWEPTSIKAGTRPYTKLPFTVGGTVATGSGDPINYQQYYITVSEPKQTYWLNDYQYVAHDIHKEDYEATLRIAGAASVTVSMNDGNDHQIANWTGDFFQGLAPYDKAPSTGQLLRLDVLSVTPL